MSRTLNDMPTSMKMFPPKGSHVCTITDAVGGRSKEKKTPYIELTITNGEVEFSDRLFVTDKAIRRLAIVAKNVCGMPMDYQLSDEDGTAVIELAKYIMANSKGKQCVVVIEENEEEYIPTSGPDMGRKLTRMRKRVAFGGYKKLEDAGAVQDAPPVATEPDEFDLPPQEPDSTLPF